MANDYYGPQEVAVPGTTVRSQQFNNNNGGVAGGFDKLPTPVNAQTAAHRYAVDTGAVENAYEITLDFRSQVTDYIEGMEVSFLSAKQNTGPATLSVNGLAPKLMVTSDNFQLTAGSIVTDTLISAQYDGTSFRVTNAVFRDIKFDTNEEQTLAANQTTVTFAVVSTTGTSYYAEGQLIDRGRLLLGEDYTVTNANTIELLRFYPAGTKILAAQNEANTNDNLSENIYESVFNRRIVQVIIGASYKQYEDDGRDLTPRLLYSGNQFTPLETPPAPADPAWTFTGPVVDNNDGTIDVPTSDGVKVFNKVNAEAVGRSEVNDVAGQLEQGDIFPIDNRTVENGDDIQPPYLRLRDVESTTQYSWTPLVYGVLSNFNPSALTAEIGGTPVQLYKKRYYAVNIDAAKEMNLSVGSEIDIGRFTSGRVESSMPVEYYDGYGAYQLPNSNWLLIDVESEVGGVILERFGSQKSLTTDTAPEEAAKVTANTEAIKAATRYSQYTGQRVVWAGSGVFKYNGMQLAYHTSNAPWLSPDQKAQRLKIIGVGQMDDGEAILYAKTGTYPSFRTVMESVNSTPALTSKTDLTQYPVRGTEIEQLTLVSSNLGSTVDIDQINTNGRLSFVTIVQKNGSGHGLRWYDSWMYSMNNVFGINVADTVSSSSLGCELKNPTIAGGMIDLTQVTFQGFGVNFVFGERNFTQPAEIISGITTNGVQGLKGVTNFEYCKGCISSSGNIRSEQASVKGVRFFNFCRDITITNIRSFNPSATVADIEFGVETPTPDKVNGHINVQILGGQADVNNAGVVRYSSTDSVGGGLSDFRLFQVNGSGAGVGADMNGSTPNGFDLNLVLESSLTTPTTGAGLYPSVLTTDEITVRREITIVTQVASAATINLPDSGNVIELTGSTTVTDIQPVVEGMKLVILSSSADITDGGNLKLSGNYTASTFSTITLFGRGGDWREQSRSINT